MFFDPCIYCQQMLIHELKITREKKIMGGWHDTKIKGKSEEKDLSKNNPHEANPQQR